MSFNKKTAVLVGSSVAVGFLGDVIMYSYGQRKPGQKFKVAFPKGKELVSVLLIGFVTGLVVDYVSNRIQDWVSSKEEKELDALVEKEKERIASGALAGKNPIGVTWA